MNGLLFRRLFEGTRADQQREATESCMARMEEDMAGLTDAKAK